MKRFVLVVNLVLWAGVVAAQPSPADDLPEYTYKPNPKRFAGRSETYRLGKYLEAVDDCNGFIRKLIETSGVKDMVGEISKYDLARGIEAAKEHTLLLINMRNECMSLRGFIAIKKP